MAITDDQKEALEAKLDTDHVSQRKQNNFTLDYIEAWWAIAEANRIFGFDGWTRETVEMRCVRDAELVKGYNGKETWRVGYMAKVRVTALGVVREGTGFGSGAANDPSDAHESAVKEAESDAMKRALMTFGNPFGLALYDKSRANVGPPPRSAASMKRTDANGQDEWDRVCGELWNELNDVNSVSSLEDLWPKWDAKLKEERWPVNWRAALAEEFKKRKVGIEKDVARELGYE